MWISQIQPTTVPVGELAWQLIPYIFGAGIAASVLWFRRKVVMKSADRFEQRMLSIESKLDRLLESVEMRKDQAR